MNGIVFDIAEGSVHDGPGLRVTVFLKGCPLRCRWCHSPEGQSPSPQWLESPTGKRRCGESHSPRELADYLNGILPFLPNGGVTFSGGEPMMQADFLLELIPLLHKTHVIIDTSGFCEGDKFIAVAKMADFIHFGIKLVERGQALEWTGASSEIPLANLHRLDNETSTPFCFRIPFFRNITDTPDNMAALETLAKSLNHLKRIDFLPPNPDAPSKYPMCGRTFDNSFDFKTPGVIPATFSPGVPFALLNDQQLQQN